MRVFDASALLAYLRLEPGADLVRQHLRAGGMISAANWSEVAQKVKHRGGDWATARGLLLSYPISVEPVTAADAERAADLWQPGAGLSLGDRLCLALASRSGHRVLTADVAWGAVEGVELIR
jgi:ribonuclease VapC